MEVREAKGSLSPGPLGRLLLRGLHAFSGWSLVYLAAGGLVGYAVEAPFTSEPSCMPFVSVFGVIKTSCSNATVNAFWFGTVGLPRLILAPPALAVALLKSAAWHGDYSHFLEARGWLLLSTPLLLLVWAGAVYWRRRYPIAAIAIVTMIVVEILALGFSE